jgi:hypothetical protein
VHWRLRPPQFRPSRAPEARSMQTTLLYRASSHPYHRSLGRLFMPLFDAARVKVVPGYCAGQRTELVETVPGRSHWTVNRCSGLGTTPEMGVVLIVRRGTRKVPAFVPSRTAFGPTRPVSTARRDAAHLNQSGCASHPAHTGSAWAIRVLRFGPLILSG